MKRVILVITLLLSSVCHAQTDTVFWFAPVDFSDWSQTILSIYSFDQQVNYSYSLPADTTSIHFPWQDGSIPPHSHTGWSHYFANNEPVNTVFNKGMLITTSSPACSYYHIFGGGSTYDSPLKRRGRYFLKGNFGLGNDFTVPMQTFLPVDSSLNRPSSIEFVATHDSTVVSITPLHPLQGGYSADSTFSITLNRGQCYIIRSGGYGTRQSLVGTRIHSTHPIAVNSTNDGVITNGGGRDFIGEQIVPNDLLGLRYVLIRNQSPYEHATIVPSIPGDTINVTINGITTQYYDSIAIDIPLTDTVTLISFDKPTAVFQTSSIDNSVDGAMVPPVECAGSKAASYQRELAPDSLLFQIVAPTPYISYFRLYEHYSNTTINVSSSLFHPLTADTTLSWCILDVNQISPFGTSFTLFNDSSKFQLAVLDRERGYGCVYGYYSDYAFQELLQFHMVSNYCVGDTIRFQYTAPHCINLTLTGPNNLRLTEEPFVLNHVDTTFTGTYYLEGFDTIGCLRSTVDSIRIHVFTREGNIQLIMDTLLCTSDSVLFQYSAPHYSNLVLSGPNGVLMSHEPFIINITDTTFSGIYRLNGIDTTGCYRPTVDSLRIKVHGGRFGLTMDSLFCVGDTIQFHYTAPYCTDLVLTGPNGVRLTEEPFILYNTDTSYSGIYRLEGTDTIGCLSTTVDSILIRVNGGGLHFTMDSLFCAGDTIKFNYTSSHIGSVSLHGPNGLLLTEPPFIFPNADTTLNGTYWITAADTTPCAFSYSDTIHLYIFHHPLLSLHDSITPRHLPWTRFGISFLDSTDTLFTRPNPANHCDSIYHYQLTILDNIYDTVLYYACEDDLPVQFDTALFYQEGEGTFHFTGSHGEDSLVTFILHVIPGSDTTIHDTISESQLPWYAFDTLFTDTVADYLYHLYNEAGCDSTIHYYLFIYWNGDHCDTILEFPNLVTPNGDGHNDRFVIKGLIENNCFKYNELTIYDRYGHQVYHRRNIATDSDWWDPAARRHPAGTYFYYFKAHGVNIWTQHTGVIEVLTDK